jgi:hypothetical protein
MNHPLKQTLILWAGLLIFGGLAFFILSMPPVRGWLWQQTGENDLLPQIKGLTDLSADLQRPRLDLAPDTVSRMTASPFGVNVFLEQEAEAAKREQAVRMASEAGFTWLRQEFPWEDIEIHGKGDFEDRRHEPFRSAWDKYDQIVAPIRYGIDRPPQQPTGMESRRRRRRGELRAARRLCRLWRFCARRRQPLPGTGPLLPALE